MRDTKSFTLIELLIVIGILAILVAAIVVVLNPAQLLAQARDGKRQQDLSALTQALNTIYALDQSVSFGTSSIVYTSLPDSTTSCATWNLPSLPLGWQYNCVSTSSLQNTDGTGWIPVNFKTTGVVSLASLPIDPVNTSSTGLYYTYVSGGSFELTAAFESTKYKLGGDKDIASTDGGLYPDLYEVGSNLALQPMDHGDPSLVGYWPLDEGTGTIAYDRSGKGNNGTWNGTPAGTNGYYSSGKVGGYAGQFNGTDNVINIPHSSVISPTGNYTLTTWFQIATTTISFFILKNGEYGFQWKGTGGGLAYYDGGYLYSTRTSWAINTWYQLVMVKSGSSVSLYINGILDSTQVGVNHTFVTATLQLGKISGLGSFSGLIDETRLYNRALSASEIQALYNATR